MSKYAKLGRYDEVLNTFEVVFQQGSKKYRGLLSLAPTVSALPMRTALAETLLPLVECLLEDLVETKQNAWQRSFFDCTYVPLFKMFIDENQTEQGMNNFQRMVRKACCTAQGLGPSAILSVDIDGQRRAVHINEVEEAHEATCVQYERVVLPYSNETLLPLYSPFCIAESEFFKLLTTPDNPIDVPGDRYAVMLEVGYQPVVPKKLLTLTLIDTSSGLSSETRILDYSKIVLPAWVLAHLHLCGKITFYSTQSSAGRQVEALQVDVGVALDHVRNAAY